MLLEIILKDWKIIFIYLINCFYCYWYFNCIYLFIYFIFYVFYGKLNLKGGVLMFKKKIDWWDEWGFILVEMLIVLLVVSVLLFFIIFNIVL